MIIGPCRPTRQAPNMAGRAPPGARRPYGPTGQGFVLAVTADTTLLPMQPFGWGQFGPDPPFPPWPPCPIESAIAKPPVRATAPAQASKIR